MPTAPLATRTTCFPCRRKCAICSTTEAMRPMARWPSGRDTTEVPTLTTIVFAFLKPCRGDAIALCCAPRRCACPARVLEVVHADRKASRLGACDLFSITAPPLGGRGAGPGPLPPAPCALRLGMEKVALPSTSPAHCCCSHLRDSLEDVGRAPTRTTRAVLRSLVYLPAHLMAHLPSALLLCRPPSAQSRTHDTSRAAHRDDLLGSCRARDSEPA